MAILIDEPIPYRPLIRVTVETPDDRLPLRGVYFIKWGEFIKVGKSDDVRFRNADWHVLLPTPTEPLAWIPVPNRWAINAHEQAVLKALYRWRSRDDLKSTEWHHDCPEVRAFIAKYGKPWPPKELRGY